MGFVDVKWKANYIRFDDAYSWGKLFRDIAIFIFVLFFSGSETWVQTILDIAENSSVLTNFFCNS